MCFGDGLFAAIDEFVGSGLGRRHGEKWAKISSKSQRKQPNLIEHD
jgi:hypothetical protein